MRILCSLRCTVCSKLRGVETGLFLFSRSKERGGWEWDGGKGGLKGELKCLGDGTRERGALLQDMAVEHPVDFHVNGR